MEKEFSAKLLDDAQNQAFSEFEALGAKRADIKLEILEQPVKKLFGMKGEYRIKAVWEKPQTSEAALSEGTSPAQSGANAPSHEHKNDLECEKVQRATAYLGRLIGILGATDYQIVPTPKDELVVLDIRGENLGVVIGRRGETLDALQYLTILASNRGEENYCRISVDCCGYREKRKEALESLADKTAKKVLKTGRRVTLEPMNPYERRIIHSKVAETTGVNSHSTGEEPFRKVVISSVSGRREDGARQEGQQRDGRRDRNDRGGRSNNNSTGGFRSYKQSSGFSTSFEREYKRTVSENIEYSKETVELEKDASLYGKIEL